MSEDQGARAIIANCDHADQWFCCTDCALAAVAAALQEPRGPQAGDMGRRLREAVRMYEMGSFYGDNVDRWVNNVYFTLSLAGSPAPAAAPRDAETIPYCPPHREHDSPCIVVNEAADRPATTPAQDSPRRRVSYGALDPATAPRIDRKTATGRADAGVSAIMQTLVNRISADLGDDVNAYLDQIEYNAVETYKRAAGVSDEALARAIGDLGPARRHLQRIEDGVLSPTMPAVIREISQAIERCVRSIEAVRAALAGGQG